MTKSKRQRPSAVAHGLIFLVGIIAAVILAKLGIFDYLIGLAKAQIILGSLIIGIFFTSILTTPAATVAFYELAQTGAPIFLVAIFGGLGAVIGDLLIFKFLEYGMGDEITLFLKNHVTGFKRLIRYRAFSITLIFLGAIIVMSPLPDELGVALMEIGKVKKRLLASLSFIFNSCGILLISLIARGLG